MFLVDPDAGGVTRQRQDTTSGRPEARLELSGAPGELIGGAGDGAAIVERGLAL